MDKETKARIERRRKNFKASTEVSTDSSVGEEIRLYITFNGHSEQVILLLPFEAARIATALTERLGKMLEDENEHRRSGT